MSLSTHNAATLLADNGALLDEYLQLVLARHSNAPRRLIEAINYSLTAGGKRLRPTLVIETWRACNDDRIDDRLIDRSALAAAGAIELIHTFSLVHDDLPAMDDDDLRRGKPTNHKIFGDAMAILAGDAMVAMAFEVIATDANPKLVAPLVREMARAAGPLGMIGGQTLDIAAENTALTLDQLQEVHHGKTGTMLTAACRMGAIAAGVDAKTLDAITLFGTKLGLAFQIVDDLLDVTSTPETLGKAVNKDATRGKNTYPGLLGIDEARSEAARQVAAAEMALSPAKGNFDVLKTLLRFVVDRHR